MENTAIQHALNGLWAAAIDKYEVDLMRRRVIFLVTVTESGSVTKHSLQLLDVSAMYFLNAEGENRLRFPEVEEGDYLEITSIEYQGSEFAQIEIHSQSPGLFDERYRSRPNVIIEIWDSWIFLEVGRICVDDVIFDARGETA